ncbi:MAG: helix-turn-helix domain-containing protein [Frankia sp.]
MLFTPDEASERLKVPAYTLKKWAREKKVPHRRVGRRILFSQDDLDTIVVISKVVTRPDRPPPLPRPLDKYQRAKPQRGPRS